MELIQALEWRYACKKMNGDAVPEEKVAAILKAIQLAPTSMGLQPFTVLVITDPELKNKIQPLAYGQTQIVDCSHLLVFCAWADVKPEQIENYISYMAETRDLPVETFGTLKNTFLGAITNKSAQQNYEWAARQTYIAFGMAIAAAASEKIDATPMEGFNPAALDELLGLHKKQLHSVTLLPLGYRDEAKDGLAKLAKVRRGMKNLFTHL